MKKYTSSDNMQMYLNLVEKAREGNRIAEKIVDSLTYKYFLKQVPKKKKKKKVIDKTTFIYETIDKAREGDMLSLYTLYMYHRVWRMWELWLILVERYGEEQSLKIMKPDFFAHEPEFPKVYVFPHVIIIYMDPPY